MAKRIITLCIAALLCITAAAEESLRNEIDRFTESRNAQTGVAVILPDGSMTSVNNGTHYPLMSVMKLHQAMAVADIMERKGISLEMKVGITKDDLKDGTYSPLRDRHPEGGIELSVKELLDYSLLLSDNNACDILFRLFGGTKATNLYLRTLGLENCEITQTEEEMHRDAGNCHKNWSTPEAAALLVKALLEQAESRPMFAHIVRTISGCKTGTDRLPAPLEDTGAIIGHKTGTGDRNSKGQLMGINDIGFVTLPDGQRYIIAVFVTDSDESPEATAGIIAEISRIVYNHVTKPQ